MVVAGAKIHTLFGVDVSGIDPETSVALTKAVLARTQIVGRVRVTWGPQVNMLAVHDADTGDLIPVYAIELHGGDPIRGWYPGTPLTAVLTELVDADGNPTRDSGRSPVFTAEWHAHRASGGTDDTFTGRDLETVTRAFEVVEMRMSAEEDL